VRIVTAVLSSAFLSSLLLTGCGTGVYRGEATAEYSFTEPLPTGPFTYISALGCAKQDVDLNTGLTVTGLPAHDDGPCITAALAKANATHPVVLVQDGASLVSSIRGPAAGHWSIVGRGAGFHGASTLFGTGFFQKAGTNDDVIFNGDAAHAGCPGGKSDPGVYTPGLPPPRGTDITLRDFAINGNRGDGANGNSDRGDPRGHDGCALMGIDLIDVNNVRISGVTFYNTSMYNLRLSDVGHATVEHSLFANMGLLPDKYEPQNGDGTHVNGPANDINIHDNYYITTDDAIALNAPEGWGGLITNVTISNSFVQQGNTLLRAYTNSSPVAAGNALPLISNVTVDNLNGFGFFCAYFGDGAFHPVSLPGTIKNFVWKNSSCGSDWGIGLTENVADLTFSNFRWISDHTASPFFEMRQGHADSISLQDITVERPWDVVPALVRLRAAPTSTVDELSIDGLKFAGITDPLPQLVLIRAPSYISQIKLKNSLTGYVSIVNDSRLTGAVTQNSRSATADQ